MVQFVNYFDLSTSRSLISTMTDGLPKNGSAKSTRPTGASTIQHTFANAIVGTSHALLMSRENHERLPELVDTYKRYGKMDGKELTTEFIESVTKDVAAFVAGIRPDTLRQYLQPAHKSKKAIGNSVIMAREITKLANPMNNKGMVYHVNALSEDDESIIFSILSRDEDLLDMNSKMTAALEAAQKEPLVSAPRAFELFKMLVAQMLRAGHGEGDVGGGDMPYAPVPATAGEPPGHSTFSPTGAPFAIGMTPTMQLANRGLGGSTIRAESPVGECSPAVQAGMRFAQSVLQQSMQQGSPRGSPRARGSPHPRLRSPQSSRPAFDEDAGDADPLFDPYGEPPFDPYGEPPFDPYAFFQMAGAMAGAAGGAAAAAAFKESEDSIKETIRSSAATSTGEIQLSITASTHSIAGRVETAEKRVIDRIGTSEARIVNSMADGFESVQDRLDQKEIDDAEERAAEKKANAVRRREERELQRKLKDAELQQLAAMVHGPARMSPNTGVPPQMATPMHMQSSTDTPNDEPTDAPTDASIDAPDTSPLKSQLEPPLNAEEEVQPEGPLEEEVLPVAPEAASSKRGPNPPGHHRHVKRMRSARQ